MERNAMTGHPGLDVFLFLLSVLASTLLALGEFAVMSASRARLEARSDTAARAALMLRDNTDADLRGAVRISASVLLVLGTVAVLPYGAVAVGGLAGVVAIHPVLSPVLDALAVLVLTAISGGIFLIFAELIARTLGVRYADAIAVRAAGTLLALTRLLHPPLRLLTATANLLLGPLRGGASFREEVTSEEELRDLIEEGTKSGLVDATEHELIESIFQFGETTAREIMVPRTDIAAIEQSMSHEDILKVLLEEGYTRMPVYDGSIDNIVGVVYAKDVLSLIEHRHLIILHDILRPVFIVPETKSISELLREFQRRRIHLAVVVDEFGGTEGIITMEDILEEIVGDIRDEYDEEEAPFDVLPGGVVEAEGTMNLADLNEGAALALPLSDAYDTVGGYVTAVCGRIPGEGDTFEAGGATITVLRVSDRRVRRVRITPAAPDR
jgi:putative hemolysin